MSLENIQLPDFLIADMYKDCLVELENVKTVHTEKAGPEAPQSVVIESDAVEPRLRYLGENKQKLSVVVNQPYSIFLEADDLQFLTNVLKACQLNIGDIAVLNIYQQPFSHVQLKKELTPETVLLFDVEPTAIHLPFSVPDFQPQVYSGTTYIKAPALKDINQPSQEARVLKSKLWLLLQKIFGLDT